VPEVFVYQAHKKIVVIIGGGVSGLRTAQLLAQNSAASFSKIIIIDKNSTIGGVLQHTQSNGFLLEHGAQGVLFTRQPFSDCIHELGIEHDLIIPNPKKQKRFIMTPNACVPLTFNFFKLLKYKLLSISDLFKIISEVFLKKPSNLEVFFNETLFAFFERHFGKKFAQTFLVSVTFGIWGGGSRKLVVRHVLPKLKQIEIGYGSLLKGFIFSKFSNLFQKKSKKSTSGLASFRDGMSFFTHTLLQECKNLCKKNNIEFVLHLSCNVISIEKNNSQINIQYQSNSSLDLNSLLQTLACDIVVYTGQPWRDDNFKILQSSEVSSEEINHALNTLRKIDSHSIAVVGLGGKVPPLHNLYPQGFGALAGEWSQDILGVIFIHSTYSAHVPENAFLYRVLLGGECNPKINHISNEEIIAIAKQRLFQSKILPENTEFEFEIVKHWENYIPLQTEHQDRVHEAVWKLEALVPGLFFTGNYLKTAAVADCLEQAEIVAKKIAAYCSKLC
jgi:oxygen-dependent protoporphyrinogen oxidase